MPFSTYADCEAFAKSHVYNTALYGWHLGKYDILRFHQETGFFRLFRREVMIREYRP